MGEKIKVVFDTNIWISIILNKILARDLVPLMKEEKITVYLSNDLLREIAKVLTYEKIEDILEQTGADPKLVLLGIVRLTTLKRTRKSLKEIKEDPADNRVLECALATKADFIVTGDRHLLALREFRGTKILKAGEFLQAIER